MVHHTYGELAGLARLVRDPPFINSVTRPSRQDGPTSDQPLYIAVASGPMV